VTGPRRAGHRLVRLASDNGRSGALPETERPGLLDALQAVRSGEAEGIVVTSLDRLARALTVQEAVLAKAWSYGTSVFTVDGGLVAQDDPDDPMRTALRQIVGVFAELDRRLVVKRLRAGRATKAAMGGRASGAPPYGWRAHRDRLAEHPGEQATLAKMRAWQAGGASFAEIARR
jgi:DNA invertase Pin-like site-specific DNA recombinase